MFAQICDADAEIPRRKCSRRKRAPGGGIPARAHCRWKAFLDALPAGIEIECEIPQIAFADLPAVEQARRAGEAVRAFSGTLRGVARPAGVAVTGRHERATR